MSKKELIGRDKELQQLKHLLVQASQGQGSIIFLEGEYGIGKASLLEELKEKIQNDQQLGKTIYVLVSCDPSRDIYEHSYPRPLIRSGFERWSCFLC